MRGSVSGLLRGFIVVLLITSSGLWAAINRGSIRGTVTDPQGSVVAGTRITITNIDTGVQQSTQTNTAGFYFLPELVPGPYKLHFEMSGFVAVDVDRVEVKPNDISTVDMALRLGRTTQTVEVTAAVPLVETTASNFSVGIEQSYMQSLPVEGRDIQSLVQLIPGVTQSNGPPGTLVGFNGGQFGGFPDPTHILGSQIAVNGAQSSANVWYLDGSLNAVAGTDNVAVSPAPDAVAEFQAITDAFAAEHGRTAGGVFNVVLKSGTNRLHGDVYEYNRNSYFESRNPFAAVDARGIPLPPNYVNSNQFGGTIGGPIDIPHIYSGKNKTFFFAAWDISKLIEKAPGALYTVPTALERQGNFSEVPSIRQFGIYDPLTTKPSGLSGSPFTRQPFLNPDGALATSLPTNRIDPVAQYVMNTYPAPNFLDPRQQNAAAGGCLSLCNNYQGSYSSGETTNNVVAKVDHQISENHKLFVEFLYNPTSYSMLSVPWKGATAPLVGFSGAFPFHVKNYIATLGDTISINPTTINEFRFSYTRQGDYPLPIPNSIQDNTALLQHLEGLNLPASPPLLPTPLWGIGGLPGFGSPSNNLVQVGQAANIADNLTKVISKHTIKAGFMFRTDITSTILPSSSNLNFGGGLTDNPVTGSGGNGMAQFLLGAVDQGSQFRITPSTIGSHHTWSFFVQDDYRVTPKFTLNLGLRYDMYGWFDDRADHASIFDFNIANPKDPVRKGAIVYFGTPAHPGVRAFPPHYKDFAPRLNFAYSPFADRKTVVRGGIDLVYTNGMTMLNGAGYGASEDPGYQQFVRWQTDATGQGLTGTGVVPAFILSQGAPNLPPYVDPKADNTQLLGAAGGGLLTQVKLPRDPNVLFWNLQIQRELPGNFAVTAAYVGSKGTELIGGYGFYSYVPTKVKQQLRSQLNTRVAMPPDLVPLFGQTYFASQLYTQYPHYTNVQCGGGCGTGGSSVYHGFLLKVEKRLSQGLEFKAAYTAQKTIHSAGIGGYFSNTWTGGSNWGNQRGRQFQLGALSAVDSYNGIQNPDNIKADRSLSGDDIPQIFNFGWTYELPLGPGKPFAGSATKIGRLLIEGWRISGNFNAESGVPRNINGPCNNLTCRVNVVGDPNSGRGSKSRYQKEQQWWNPNAFQAVFGSDPAIIALATSGTPQQKDAHDEFWRFGTAGFTLGNARSPSFWDVDMAATKDFRISEAKYFQLRVESYNALNHQSLGLPSYAPFSTPNWCLPPNPDGSVDAVHQFGCSFGRINAVQRDPRAFQFGLKFVF